MLEPKLCPAGKCSAEIYCVGDLVFCPKCREKNPNFQLKTEVSRIEKQPEIDLETGIIKW